MLYKNIAKHAYYQVISMQSTIYIFVVLKIQFAYSVNCYVGY